MFMTVSSWGGARGAPRQTLRTNEGARPGSVRKTEMPLAPGRERDRALHTSRVDVHDERLKAVHAFQRIRSRDGTTELLALVAHALRHRSQFAFDTLARTLGDAHRVLEDRANQVRDRDANVVRQALQLCLEHGGNPRV